MDPCRTAAPRRYLGPLSHDVAARTCTRRSLQSARGATPAARSGTARRRTAPPRHWRALCCVGEPGPLSFARSGRPARRIVRLRADERHHPESALLRHHRADIELRAPLARAPHARVALLLTGIQQQLRELASRRLDLVRLVPAALQEPPRRGLRHIDLSRFGERWT